MVQRFREVLPHATVYVFDNNSTDETAQIASRSGATVFHSPKIGKGNVVQHMFRTIEADIYVLADGDNTYPASAAPELLRALRESNADMVVGTRLKNVQGSAFRSMHEWGNRGITKIISMLFASSLTDVLSGYRVLKKDLVRNLFLRASGFEIETEITIQALLRRRVIKEVPILYRSRPSGSSSKLSTYGDGLHIIKAIALIFKDYRPLHFFMILALLCFSAGIIAGIPPITDYVQKQYVDHVPLALLAAALMILAVVFGGTGLILNAIKRFHFESLESMDRLSKNILTSGEQDRAKK